MTESLLVLLPLLAVPIVLLFRFIGCGEILSYEDPPGFTPSVKPADFTVYRGANEQEATTVTVASNGGFSDNTVLTVEASKGVTAKFDPHPVKPEAYKSVDTKLKLTVASDADFGLKDLTIVGESTGPTKFTGKAILKLNVSDFEISLAPASLTIGRGETMTVTVTIKSLGAFDKATNLGTPGLAGMSASFLPVSVTPAAGASSTSTLTIQAAGVTAGPQTLQIMGSAMVGSSPGTLTHGVPLPITVIEPDFSLSVTPPAVSAQRGQPLPAVTVNISRVGGFAAPVDFSVPGFPNIFTFSPDPAPGNTSAISATVPAAQPIGLVSVTVIGVGGSLTRAATFTINVT